MITAQATRKFQKTFGFSHSFKDLPLVLAYTFIGIYLLYFRGADGAAAAAAWRFPRHRKRRFWLFSFLNSVSLVEEWHVLTDSRKIVTRRGSVRYADKWNVTHILRSIQFQMMHRSV